MDDVTVGIIAAVGLMVMVFGGVRIYLAMAFAGLFGVVGIIGWHSGAANVGMVPHAKGTAYTLSVLPMFILIGYLAYYAGLTQALFVAAKRWIGWVPGGLAVASVFACAGFAAVSGASTATAAVFSRVAIPEMLENGYDRRLAAGVVAAGGTLASLIPPSAILVIYAIIVEQSVGQLLVAGFIPGIITAIIYAAIIIIRVSINPELGQPITGFTWGERMQSLPGMLPVVAVIAIIFSAMYFGWATPTEAGAVGAFVVFVAAVFRRMKWRELEETLLDTAKLTVMIFSLIWGVLIFVRLLGFAALPDALQDWILALDVPPLVVLLFVIMIYIVLGMFMDAIGMLLLTLPVVYPVVISLGYHPIWFGIIIVKMCEIGLITPPVGLNCYVVAGVRPDIPLADVFRGASPFIIAELIVVSLFIAFPQLILWVPLNMYN